MSGSFSGNELPKAFGSSCNYNSSKRYESKNDSTFKSASEKLFEKKFEFQKEEDWHLPEASQIFVSEPWKVRHLQTLKNGLNFQKSRLNDYPIEDWSAHTAKRNPAGDVRWKLRHAINPEFLTQAWTKFYECVCNYNIVPEQAINSKQINTLHLCEAPGAFIAAFNHFLKQHHQDFQWKWLATTLNPYHEDNGLSDMICDDRFILHTLRHWDFGLDYSGNLMDIANSQRLILKAKALGEIHLITADGSIDCMLKPDEQEDVVAPLHFCEVITALRALSKGGSFLFKLFTMFEHSTINLMYVLVCGFEYVNIYKPSTSKEGNSEVYAVCIGYLGDHFIKDHIDNITHFYGHRDFSSKALFPLECLPDSFLEQIQSCAYYFYNRQCQVINDNIIAFENPNQRRDAMLKRHRSVFATMFLERYELASIAKSDEILCNIFQEEQHIHLNPRNHQGTFTERLHLKPVSYQEKVIKLHKELTSLMETYKLVNNEEISWLDCTKLYCSPLSYTHGKPVKRIRSSKFVLSWILKLYITLTDNCCDLVNFNVTDSVADGNLLISFAAQEANERYDDWEKKNLSLLKDKLMSLKVGETLMLKNFRALSQFSAGVLYLLAQTSFRELGFSNDSMIVLKNFHNEVEIISLLESITAEVSATSSSLSSNDDNKTVLGVVPIQNLSLGTFYSLLLRYNNNFLYARSVEILAQLTKSLNIETCFESKIYGSH